MDKYPFRHILEYCRNAAISVFSPSLVEGTNLLYHTELKPYHSQTNQHKNYQCTVLVKCRKQTNRTEKKESKESTLRKWTKTAFIVIDCRHLTISYHQISKDCVYDFFIFVCDTTGHDTQKESSAHHKTHHFHFLCHLLRSCTHRYQYSLMLSLKYMYSEGVQLFELWWIRFCTRSSLTVFLHTVQRRSHMASVGFFIWIFLFLRLLVSSHFALLFCAFLLQIVYSKYEMRDGNGWIFLNLVVGFMCSYLCFVSLCWIVCEL